MGETLSPMDSGILRTSFGDLQAFPVPRVFPSVTRKRRNSVNSALGRVALTLLAALTLAGIASAATAGPSVKITSPRSGTTVSLRRTPYLAIAGTAAFASSEAQTSTFYLHRG